MVQGFRHNVIFLDVVIWCLSQTFLSKPSLVSIFNLAYTKKQQKQKKTMVYNQDRL